MYRRHHLKRLESAIKKGEVDERILPLLDIVNSSDRFVTTSSCSGRTVLIETTSDERKRRKAFYRKWHDYVSVTDVWDAIKSYSGNKVLWYKYDPLILHVAASGLSEAMLLLRGSRKAGIKVAGVQVVDSTKVHVEIRGLDYMALPVYDRTPLVDRRYVEYIVTTSNMKHKRNLKRLKKLEKELYSVVSKL